MEVVGKGLSPMGITEDSWDKTFYPFYNDFYNDLLQWSILTSGSGN